MKEMKVKELRDVQKDKDRGSPLSHHIKEEIRHSAISLMQTGEEQDNASDYASDKAIKTADRVASEAAHGVSSTMEAGKHLFEKHLQKEPQASQPEEAPITEEVPLCDTPPEAKTVPHTSPGAAHNAANRQEPLYPQPVNAPVTDFKGRASNIHVEDSLLSIGNHELRVESSTMPDSPISHFSLSPVEFTQQETVSLSAPEIDFKGRDSIIRMEVATTKAGSDDLPFRVTSPAGTPSEPPISATGTFMQKEVEPQTGLSPQIEIKAQESNIRIADSPISPHTKQDTVHLDAPAKDVKCSEINIQVNEAPLKTTETIPPNAPQVTPNSELVAKLEKKRVLIEPMSLS